MVYHIKAFELSDMYTEDTYVYGCASLQSGEIDSSIEMKLIDFANSTAVSIDKVRFGKDKVVALISYATQNIFNYASYSAAINSIYAKEHGYYFYLVDADQNNFEPADSRWNKVKIIENFLSYRDDIDYFVWLDSDLIVMDFNFDLINDVIDKYSDAHIIASRDPRPENGLINTGNIIVKNSVFSRVFFDSWWNAFDRAAGMDQHVFDKIWDLGQKCSKAKNESIDDSYIECKYTKEESEKSIIMLEAAALNSQFPAWINQKKHDSFLHLAGVSSFARKKIFQSGLQEICRAVQDTNKRILGHQLNLEIFFLYDIITNNTMYIEEAKKLTSEIVNITESIGSSTIPDIIHIQNLQGRGRDCRQVGYTTDQAGEIPENLVFIENTKVLYQLMITTWDFAKRYKSDDAQYLLEILQNILDSAYNHLVEIKETKKRLELLLNIEVHVNELIRITDIEMQEQNKVQSMYYTFKFYGFLAKEYSDFTNNDASSLCNPVFKKEILALDKAYNIWLSMDMSKWYGSGNSYSDPGKEVIGMRARYGSLLCECGEMTSTTMGISALFDSIEIIDRTWGQKLKYSGIQLLTRKNTLVKETNDTTRNDEDTPYIPAYVLKNAFGVYLSMIGCFMKSFDGVVQLSTINFVGEPVVGFQNDEIKVPIDIEVQDFFSAQVKLLFNHFLNSDDNEIHNLADEFSEFFRNTVYRYEKARSQYNKEEITSKNKKWKRKKRR